MWNILDKSESLIDKFSDKICANLWLMREIESRFLLKEKHTELSIQKPALLCSV